MQSAEKLSITLPPEMASFIRQKVDSGLYGSNSEIIRKAMRALMERERLDGELPRTWLTRRRGGCRRWKRCAGSYAALPLTAVQPHGGGDHGVGESRSAGHSPLHRNRQPDQGLSISAALRALRDSPLCPWRSPDCCPPVRISLDGLAIRLTTRW